jgi:hypothetical protein
MVCHPLGFLGMGAARGLRLVLGERTGMPHHTPDRLLLRATIRLLHVNAAEGTLAAPASGPLLRGAPGLFA